jgi:hypothetical protein
LTGSARRVYKQAFSDEIAAASGRQYTIVVTVYGAVIFRGFPVFLKETVDCSSHI